VSSRVQAVVDWYGASDVLQMFLYASSVDHNARLSAESKLVGGPIQQRPELSATANPITYVTADDPPFLVMHGTVDDTNPFNQSELLVDALRSGGVPVSFVPVQGADHGFMTDATAQTTYTFLDGVFHNPPAALAPAPPAEDDLQAGTSSLPAVSLTASQPSATEGGATGALTVTRTGDTSQALVVSYTVSGTATPGTDYTSLPGTVTLPAGQASATVTVTPIADGIPEPTETVILTLLPASSYTVGSPATADVAIADASDPTKPIVSVSATDPTAAEQGPDPGTFTLSRTGSTGSPLTVDLVLSGSAEEGTDYAWITTPVTFAAGASRVQVTITPLADTPGEPMETVHLAASGTAILAGPYVPTVTLAPSLAGFYTVTPCRLVDTRQAAGPQGGPALAAGSSRVFTVAGSCGVPAEATAVSLNVTVANPGASGFFTLYAAGTQRPMTSTLSFQAGQVRGNNAIVSLAGAPPGLAVFYSAGGGTADVILDVNGYFR
jgi:hypothetical protein